MLAARISLIPEIASMCFPFISAEEGFFSFAFFHLHNYQTHSRPSAGSKVSTFRDAEHSTLSLEAEFSPFHCGMSFLNIIRVVRSPECLFLKEAVEQMIEVAEEMVEVAERRFRQRKKSLPV